MPTNDPAETAFLFSSDADPIRVLVSWRPDADGAEAVELAAWLARTGRVRIRVVMTYVRLWPTSSRNRTGDKYRKWHRQQTERYTRKVAAALSEAGIDHAHWDPEVAVFSDGVSEATMLTEAAMDFSADLLVLGTDVTAPKGRFRASSTAETLLHSSPHPVALTPRAVKLSKRGVTRINLAFLDADHEQHEILLNFAARLAHHWHLPLRLVAFSPQGLTKASDKISADIARTISDEWYEQALGMLDRARDAVMEEVSALEVTTAIGAGAGWAGAIDALKWKKGDLICLGSVPRGPIERVFIGSHEAEFLRHVQVPVLLSPAPRV
ncbi:MAG TPA: universal stress protein [Corynebacterium sp.]|nr:universal stress protein [Corynebacterium sp.]